MASWSPKSVDELVKLLVVCTLALVIIAVIGVLLIGLFEPKVDNEKIFGILSPAFASILGYFIGRSESHKPDKS